MRPCLSLLLLIAVLCFADASFIQNDKVIKHSKYVYTVVDAQDDVHVAYGGKSKTRTTCKMKVDFKKQLLSNDQCKIKEFTVFSEDTLYLGHIKTSYGELSFDNYHSYTSIKLDGINIDDIKFLVVWFVQDSIKASDSSRVQCDSPKAKKVYGNGYFECYVPWKCPGFMKNKGYSISEDECDYLPANAVRNKEAGWHCKKGFVQVADSCEVKPRCKKNERYYENFNRCLSLPQNSHWKDSALESTDFECNEGFVFDEEALGCIKQPDEN